MPSPEPLQHKKRPFVRFTSRELFCRRCRRLSPSCQGDAVARGRTRQGRIAGCPVRHHAEARRYWATDYDWRKCEAKINALRIHHRDRRARHSLHSREVEGKECAADHHHPRMAGLDHRADEDHRATHQSHGARRKRRGRVRCRDSVAAGLRILRQADGDRMGSAAHRARVDDADEAPRLHEVRGARRRLGQRRHRS